ncbi:unnamed protein product [Parnassius apollo]|uniref:(apollo) hypothetical protein n=1 Tax=Parnassius apollo TaxID=110799 RepID=A0A8S3W6I9_PARAO|nr:unnamed protein product [Parnassius apollo]
MEKTLPLPRIPTNIVFHKRQLWLYNCDMHSGKIGKGFLRQCGIAGRGAQEVNSTLRKHISLNLDSKVKELIVWSDSCGGQNQNIKLTLLLFAVLVENDNLEKITLRFMVPGHSYLENDSEFSDIEPALKIQTRLYTPQDYIDVMTSCHKRNKLTATKMECLDFVVISKMMKTIVNRKKI